MVSYHISKIFLQIICEAPCVAVKEGRFQNRPARVSRSQAKGRTNTATTNMLWIFLSEISTDLYRYCLKKHCYI